MKKKKKPSKPKWVSDYEKIVKVLSDMYNQESRDIERLRLSWENK